MFVTRKTGMLLAGIFALLAFCWQANACFVEHAGIIPCHEQTDDCSTASDGTEGHCCHVESSIALTQGLPGVSIAFQEIGYHLRTFGAPDGPVEEIDHPPQILS
jgi:hypothetical protein